VPRRPDPDLEEKILDAAQKLWKKGGEKGLTMRAVAKAAGTNTPSVYRRFRDREDILRGLVQRVRLEITALLESASSPEEGCERYVNYALSHPHEYELFYQHEYELFHSARSSRRQPKLVRPGVEAMKRKLAEKLGGAPEKYANLTLGLWMVVHGASMLLIAKTILPKDAEAAREVLSTSVAAIVNQAGRY
jgi:AcrR family transcriptional regulator